MADLTDEIKGLVDHLLEKYKIRNKAFYVRYFSTAIAEVSIKDNNLRHLQKKSREISIILPISPHQKEKYIFFSNFDGTYHLSLVLLRESEIRETLAGLNLVIAGSCSTNITLISFSETKKKHRAVGVEEEKIIALIYHLKKNLGEISPKHAPTKPS